MMKTKLILTLMILLNACSTTNDEKPVSVIDYKNPTGGEPKVVNLASHKDKNVEVFRINGKDSYHTVMYRLENGNLKAYESGVTSNNNYDKATYKWINDSTLSYKLINSSNSASGSYIMIGNKEWTQLEKIDE
jgi:hypothetical protein